ncbi:hypothetical protein NKR19_g7763 [Coniochaeta hoffmannii]|uniref:Uncharacterized protein n=1 Tax=Coniochaeta hoffmannii TaxID=91930 RepID=A0AA38R818_9PEZI|nr:hypothetical protein NKR19_g7763 [Coniochaeta hoffmannii]
MKAVTLKRVLLSALLLITSSALAVHEMRTISVADFIQRRISRPDDGLTLLMMDDEGRQHIKIWQTRLKDKSLRVVGPCRQSEGACLAPPLPFFPWSVTRRNEMLMRPAPDVVRANIRAATNGTLSTVDELVARVNANLADLSVLDDDEVSLLITSFAVPQAELNVEWGCGPVHYGGWHEDLLISQDEQRALLAGFLYAWGDEGFFARRMADLDEGIRSLGYVPRTEPAEGQQCEPRIRGGAYRFVDRVDRLNREAIISETEWLRRYGEHLAALRADIYATAAAGGVRDWDSLKGKAEAVVSAAEAIADQVIGRSIPLMELRFVEYLGDNERAISYALPGLGCGTLRRVAYRRWKETQQ